MDIYINILKRSNQIIVNISGKDYIHCRSDEAYIVKWFVIKKKKCIFLHLLFVVWIRNVVEPTNAFVQTVPRSPPLSKRQQLHNMPLHMSPLPIDLSFILILVSFDLLVTRQTLHRRKRQNKLGRIRASLCSPVQ